MIKVNGRNSEWEEGLTVRRLLEKKNYTFPSIVVQINEKFIPPSQYETTAINDGDEVKVIHLTSGG